MKQLHAGRSCGPCTACCKPFKVPEVGKHDASWCPHCVKSKGCNIYAQRPDACRKFACIWLNGKGGENDRPDRLGVMMDVEELQLGSRIIGIIHFWEIKKGAIDSPRVRAIAEANKNNGFVVTLHAMRGDDGYQEEVEMRKRHFTEAESHLFQALWEERFPGKEPHEKKTGI